jgi:hypothetical protein
MTACTELHPAFVADDRAREGRKGMTKEGTA